MSNQVQSVLFNNVLGMQHQDLLSLIPHLKSPPELLQLRDTLEQSFSEYGRIKQDCDQLSFDMDRLLHSMSILIPSPTCLSEANELIIKENLVTQRFDEVEDCNQNLLNCLSESTCALLSQHQAENGYL